jgi:hypothetical protein
MRKPLALLMALILGLICAGLAVADYAADTKALVENSVGMAKERGLEPPLKAIGDPNGPFVKGALYLFAGSLDKVTATAHHFATDKLVGPDLTNLKDSKGSQFFFKFKEIAEKPGSGWVEYWWPKLGAKEPSMQENLHYEGPRSKCLYRSGLLSEINNSSNLEPPVFGKFHL